MSDEMKSEKFKLSEKYARMNKLMRMFERMLKVLKINVCLKQCYTASAVGIRVVIGLNSFREFHDSSVFSGAIVSFVNDCRIVKVNDMVANPRMFCNFRTLNANFSVSGVLLSSGDKRSFCCANVRPWT